MSDAGGEYKSRAFNDSLKGEGICLFQSAPHTPQQNSHTECFMHTIMDKSEAMWHEACIPDSWWEFTIAHAMHIYNCTLLQHHNWCTPYEMLHKQQPDIAHLRVFGCATDVHIPEDIRTNKMAFKSEHMVYLGVAPRNSSNFLFIWSPNNILFTSTYALFDELRYSYCTSFYTNWWLQTCTISCKGFLPSQGNWFWPNLLSGCKVWDSVLNACTLCLGKLAYWSTQCLKCLPLWKAQRKDLYETTWRI